MPNCLVGMCIMRDREREGEQTNMFVRGGIISCVFLLWITTVGNLLINVMAVPIT